MAKDQVVINFNRRVRGSLTSTGMTGKSLVVAVSGGPDSLALLYSLHSLQADLRLRLHGAHLDHCLRGEASKADAIYVKAIFESLGVPHTLERADVASYQATHRVSLEQAARTVRYHFLARVARDENADAIAVGHTADDQAETVLMHIIRGSGLSGLQGMETIATRCYEGVDISLLRPMLSITRDEILEYCRASGLEPREDESNLSLEFTRNRVRHELIPMLERFNPAVRDALVRLASSTRVDLSYIEKEVDAQWQSIATVQEHRVSLRVDELKQLDPAIQRHLVRRAVSSVKGNLEDLQQVHIEDMLNLISAGPAGKALDLPGGLRFALGYDVATIAAARQEDRLNPRLVGEVAIKIPGEISFGQWRILAEVMEEPSEVGAARLNIASDKFSTILNYDLIEDGLVVRGREDGDHFQPLGMTGHKKLQDFMVDAKIPRECREGVPIVASRRGIVWVVGHRIADWARVPDDASSCLVLRFSRDQQPSSNAAKTSKERRATSHDRGADSP